MNALRILIPILIIPFFVSAMFADAMDQGSIVTRTLQISSLTDDFDLLCEKTKISIAVSNLSQPARPFPAKERSMIAGRAVRTSPRILVPFFLRAPPLP